MTAIMPDMLVHAECLRDEHGIVAEHNGDRVGYTIVRVNGKEAFLRDLFVEPQYFRDGVGRALFHAAADYARQRGSTECY
jgi:GNAT superfamily N-acetyltransferase